MLKNGNHHLTMQNCHKPLICKKKKKRQHLWSVIKESTIKWGLPGFSSWTKRALRETRHAGTNQALTHQLGFMAEFKIPWESNCSTSPWVASHTAEESSVALSAGNHGEWATPVPSRPRAWLHPREVWGQLAFRARLHSSLVPHSSHTHETVRMDL